MKFKWNMNEMIFQSMTSRDGNASFISDNPSRLQMLLASSITKKWKRRFCIISGGCLFIFNDPKDASPIYVIPLANLSVEGGAPRSEKKDTITIYNPKSKMKLAKLQKEQKYTEVDEIYFIAENWRKKCEWMLSLQLNSSIVPNYNAIKTQ